MSGSCDAREISAEEMKELQLELLRKFDAFCKEHKLRYWLSDGTLLGAIRHNGFIPWDDDIDVNMPKEDYYRLCEMINAGESFGEHCRFASPLVQSPITYHCPFGKLYDTRSILRQDVLADHLKVEEGVWIDIFPITGLPEDAAQQKKVLDWLWDNWLMIWLSSYRFNLNCSWKRGIKRLLFYIPARIKGIDYWLQKQERYVKALPSYENSENALDSACFNHVMKSSFFTAGLTEHVFEDGLYPIPVNWEDYLVCIYGDWQELPPEDKRNGGHSYKVYWR